MITTVRLRALLNERGVEWTANDGEYVKETCWSYMGELTAAFAEFDNGTTLFACDTWPFTPEQAIAATLGRGECEMEYVNDFMSWHCKACDMMDMAPHNPKPCYCKWCGAKVVKWGRPRR